MAKSTNIRQRPRNLQLLGGLAAFGLLLASCGESTDDVDAAADEVAEAAQDAGVDTDEVASEIDEASEDLADGADTDELDAQSADLAQALRDNGLTTLASAVEQVDIQDIVGDEEFTFLAPNDEAFLALTADDTADLLADPAELANVLRNHVVEERLDAAALTGLDSVTTASGQTLSVVVNGDTVSIGPATVATADIAAGDGVIHAIDQVLLP